MAKYTPGAISGYSATGTSHSVASGRISYAFGLSGPALTADTGALQGSRNLQQPGLASGLEEVVAWSCAVCTTHA